MIYVKMNFSEVRARYLKIFFMIFLDIIDYIRMLRLKLIILLFHPQKYVFIN